jgi:eukaryotic-like serine/threonine-protein kinase
VTTIPSTPAAPSPNSAASVGADLPTDQPANLHIGGRLEVPDWADVRACLERALPLSPTERDALLAAPALSPALVAEVRSLLAHEVTEPTQDRAGFLARPASLDPAAGPDPGRLGQRLGAWLITHKLGSGGMGEVWLAERADGAYTSDAAVKVLKRGMDSASVLARFALEQQSLARLQHPHIAHLLDAGRTTDGLPYFVMERVLGQPIDKACAGLTLEARLVLFLQLTDAVSHAHRNLLVHRDLKPSNVMVTPEGQVKLLDFGIAKALYPLDPGRADAGLTQQGPRPFTPQYASPEQVRGEPVNTATDIYSLGVLLYQLLTGTRPTGRQASSPAEVARCVLEDEPTKPSRLSAAQTLDPQWLTTRKKLAGDLDKILLKALEKTTDRRYVSVDALAADVRAHLQGYPVSARSARPAYLLSRFVLRNKVSMAAAGVALLAVLGGAGVALWQAQLAQAQRGLAERRFDEVRQFARTMLFDVDTALRDGPTAGREKLVATTLGYLDTLSGERLSDVALMRDLAEAYERVGEIQGGSMQSNLGRPKDARVSQDKALVLREKLVLLAPQDQANLAGLANTHSSLGDLARSQGQLQDAAKHYGQAVVHSKALARAQPDELKWQLKRVESQRYLASVHYWPFHKSLGNYQQARSMIEALDREMDALLPRHPDNVDLLSNYGGLLNQLTEFQRISGEFAASLATQRKSNRLAAQLLATAPNNPRWQRWMFLAEGHLCDALFGTGDFEAGVQTWLASIRRREQVVAADPADERAQRNLANAYGPLAEALDALGHHPKALTWYARENALLRELRVKHPQVKVLVGRLDESDRDLALQLLQVGRVAEAVARQRELDQRRGVDKPPEDADDGKFALLRAQVLLATPNQAPAPSAQILAHARAGLALLRKEAAAEPFNALLAREAALGAHTLAVASATQDPGAACALVREASLALEALSKAGRLPAHVVAQREDARRRSAACPA